MFLSRYRLSIIGNSNSCRSWAGRSVLAWAWKSWFAYRSGVRFQYRLVFRIWPSTQHWCSMATTPCVVKLPGKNPVLKTNLTNVGTKCNEHCMRAKTLSFCIWKVYVYEKDQLILLVKLHGVVNVLSVKTKIRNSYKK